MLLELLLQLKEVLLALSGRLLVFLFGGLVIVIIVETSDLELLVEAATASFDGWEVGIITIIIRLLFSLWFALKSLQDFLHSLLVINQIEFVFLG